MNNKDEIYMLRCLELASGGIRAVAPNPMVGAVIVHNGRIIGEGYHKQFGREHAEVNAIENVKDKELLKQSTLYVNLEPCAHHGKTPPCSDLIIKMGIPRVIIGAIDANEMVNGRGAERLKKAGITVIAGVLENQSVKLNKRFFTFHQKKRPYIILKWAETLDGFIDRDRNTGDSAKPAWITDEVCRTLVHRWRTEEQAILVGLHTVLKDDPQLTARLWPGMQPAKMVIDRKLQIPFQAKIFASSSPVFVFNAIREGKLDHVHYCKLDFNNLIPEMLKFLYNKNIQSILVEGGAILINSLMDAGIWDEARIFTGPVKFGSGIKGPQIRGQCISDNGLSNSRLRIFYP